MGSRYDTNFRSIKEIIIDLKDTLKVKLNKREHINNMIKGYTNDWVNNEESIIQLEETIKKLEK